MPSLYLDVHGAEAAAGTAAKAASQPPATGQLSAGDIAALKLVGDAGTFKDFLLKAVKVPEITADDALMARCSDDSPTGFYHSNKA